MSVAKQQGMAALGRPPAPCAPAVERGGLGVDGGECAHQTGGGRRQSPGHAQRGGRTVFLGQALHKGLD
ncbi:MAG: hypothetical protein ACRDRS_08030 [Pseudonocardiaceae bacterium]